MQHFQTILLIENFGPPPNVMWIFIIYTGWSETHCRLHTAHSISHLYLPLSSQILTINYRLNQKYPPCNGSVRCVGSWP